MTCRLSTSLFSLRFRFPFRIAHGLRFETPAIFVCLTCGDDVYFGEATFPPYLTETQQSATAFIDRIPMDAYHPGMHPEAFYSTLQALDKGNFFAKAAVDMAVWNAYPGREHSFPVPQKAPASFYTIAVCAAEEMNERYQHGLSCGFRYFKLKLDGKEDQEAVRHFRSLSDAPFAVDANSSWTSLPEAIQTATFLRDQGCLFIEQPFSPADNKLSRALKDTSIIPLIADESLQTINDLEEIAECFHGGNIKLLKCGGLTPGKKMAEKMKAMGLKILIGCMSESITGCEAAAHLAGFADWLDLDGPFLTIDDRFHNH